MPYQGSRVAMRDGHEKLRRWQEKVLKSEEKKMLEVMPRKKRMRVAKRRRKAVYRRRRCCDRFLSSLPLQCHQCGERGVL